jgi:hypothetical protein
MGLANLELDEDPPDLMLIGLYIGATEDVICIGATGLVSIGAT